jgi:hypothetical protein
MDTLTFISEMVKALIWPVVVLILVAILRKPISDLIPLLQHLKYKELELDFGRRAEAIQAEAAAHIPQIAVGPSQDEHIQQLAQVSPRSAVIEAWMNVESAAKSAFSKLFESNGPRSLITTSSFKIIDLLGSNSRVSPEISSFLRRLREMRNQAVHTPEFVITQQSALEYADAADKVASYLRSI